MSKYKLYDFVEIISEEPTSVNKTAKIVNIEGDYIYVSNGNMPFLGTFCNKKFHKDEVKLIT